MKKILFPTDFSKASNNAFAYASILAKELNAIIDIIHVYNIPFATSIVLPDEGADEMWEARRNSLYQKMDELEEMFPTSKVRIKKLKYGIFIDTEISDFATKGKYDLIVMGMKGTHNRIEKIMGTVTTNLMMKAPCPVLAIPEEALYEGINDVAFATDLQPGDDLPIEKAFEFAEDFGAELHFVYVDKLVRRPKEMMSKVGTDDDDILAYTKVTNPSVVEGLESYLEKSPMDILSLYIPKRRLWEKLFHHRTSKAMAYHTKIPLLVFR